MTHLSLTEMLERYATLRDTILGLETEKEALAKQIKDSLQAGAHLETELYRARLKTTRRVVYPTGAFRHAFGDELTLAVATVDRKKVDELAQLGELDEERLSEIAEVKEIQALHLIPKTIE